MSIVRFSDYSNWYIFHDICGYVSVYHKENYENVPYHYGENIEEYIKKYPIKLSDSDEQELREYLEFANEEWES